MRCRCPILVKKKSGLIAQVPCGQCIHCRLNHARMWSIRIMHEAELWKDNIFLTLTYDDEHLPANGTLVKKHLTDFFKRFRQAIKKPVRYFACGEYGSKYHRPHYHIILHNVSKDDIVFTDLSYDKKTHGWYCNCLAWSMGLCHIGSVTVDSANYVAGYVVKKQKGKNAKDYYAKLGVIPEFCVMSRKPGLGFGYLQEHMSSLSKKMYVFCKGYKYALPRFYADRMNNASERRDYAMEQEEKRFSELKKKAERNGRSVYQLAEEEDIQAEANTRARLKQKERNYEN